MNVASENLSPGRNAACSIPRSSLNRPLRSIWLRAYRPRHRLPFSIGRVGLIVLPSCCPGMGAAATLSWKPDRSDCEVTLVKPARGFESAASVGGIASSTFTITKGIL